MKKLLKDYPITDMTIELIEREIQLTIVDGPDHLLEKLSRIDDQGRLFLPYWMYLWESAIGLAHYISDMDDLFYSRRVLEIGCGFGLVGIVATLAGAKTVFTDFEQDALLFTKHNAEQNGINSADYVQMDWNNPCFQTKFDIILASDVIYEEENWKPILNILHNLLNSGGIAILSEPNRKSADGFLKCLHENGFEYHKATCPTSFEEKSFVINILSVKGK